MVVRAGSPARQILAVGWREQDWKCMLGELPPLPGFEAGALGSPSSIGRGRLRGN